MRTNFSVTVQSSAIKQAIHTELAAIVRDAIEAHRARGQKTEHAMQLAARELGISPRRVKSWRYGEVYTVPAEEAETIRAAKQRLEKGRVDKLRAELALAEARLSTAEQKWASFGQEGKAA